jgi:hypothetical protein
MAIHPLGEREQQHTAYGDIKTRRDMYRPSKVITEVPDEIEAHLISGRCGRKSRRLDYNPHVVVAI